MPKIFRNTVNLSGTSVCAFFRVSIEERAPITQNIDTCAKQATSHLGPHLSSNAFTYGIVLSFPCAVGELLRINA